MITGAILIVAGSGGMAAALVAGLFALSVAGQRPGAVTAEALFGAAALFLLALAVIGLGAALRRLTEIRDTAVGVNGLAAALDRLIRATEAIPARDAPSGPAPVRGEGLALPRRAGPAAPVSDRTPLYPAPKDPGA